jgi:hypothetical protein
MKMSNSRKHSSKTGTSKSRQTALTQRREAVSSLLRRIMTPTPFKDVFITKLRYADVRQLTTDATSGVIGTEQTFRLNSLFDPDFTNAGHQPMGFDQITPFYGSYQVDAVEITTEWFGSTSNSLMCFMTIQSGQNQSALAGTSCTIAYERQEVLSRGLPIAGRDVWRHTEIVPIHLVVGLSKQQYRDDPNYRALVGSNPATQAYIRFAVGDTGTGSSTKCTIGTTFVFHCRFFDRINPGQS